MDRRFGFYNESSTAIVQELVLYCFSVLLCRARFDRIILQSQFSNFISLLYDSVHVRNLCRLYVLQQIVRTADRRRHFKKPLVGEKAYELRILFFCWL